MKSNICSFYNHRLYNVVVSHTNL